MLIQLAIEVWMEILDWLRCHRVELAWKFIELGDRQFSDICQHWLHDYKRNAIELDDYLNGTVLNFLNRMLPLLKDIFLSLDRELPETGATVKALGHLLPLFDGITAIQLEAKLFAHIHEHFDSTFERANILHIHNDPVPEVIGWLRGAKQEDDQQKEPRMLLLKIENKMGTAMAQLEEFLKIIREDFLRSSSSTSPPVCFFVCVRVRPERQLGAIPESTRLENGDTGEQLIMEKWEEEVPTWREIVRIPLLLVARCPSNANPEWLAERMRAIRDFHIRRQRRHIFVDWQFETGGLITKAKKRKLQL